MAESIVHHFKIDVGFVTNNPDRVHALLARLVVGTLGDTVIAHVEDNATDAFVCYVRGTPTVDPPQAAEEVPHRTDDYGYTPDAHEGATS